jgi:phage terminase small subunit
MALTPKQEAFCLAYLKTGNASEAYRQAYNAANMKPETINNKASALIKKGEIGARITELNQSAVTDSVMTRQRALERLSLIAETSGQRNHLAHEGQCRDT